MRKLILMSALSIFLATSYAQVVFSKVVSNLPLRAETTWGIQEVIDGYIAVSAIFCSYDEQKICCVIFKLNKEGDIAWFEQFDFYPNAYASLAVRENKIYLCGSTNQGDKQFLLYCLDLEGNIIWSREYGNPTQDELGPTFTFTSDNHIVLCGIRMPNTAGIPLQVVYLVKTDLDGNLVAEYSYGFQNDQSLGRTVIETTDRQMIFSYGACPVSCFVEFTAGVASVDTLGNLNWNLAFPFAFQPDRPHVIQTDSQTLVANWHTHTALPNHDLEPPTLFYLNRSGQIQSQLVLENQSLKAIDDLAPLWGKGLVGSGSNYPHYLTDPNPDPAGWVFRVNENRELLWDRTYTDTAFQGKAFGLQSIVPTSDGGYIAVGTIANHMTGVFESHNWILKLEALDAWVRRPGPLANNIDPVPFTTGTVLVNPLAASTTPDFRPVAGSPALDGANFEFYLLDPPSLPSRDLDAALAAPIYPNPISNGQLHFGRLVAAYGIFDVKGQLVKYGFDADHANLTGFSAGVYFIRLDGQVQQLIVE